MNQESEYYEGGERSEHSSLEDFDESDNSFHADDSPDGNIDLETIYSNTDFMGTISYKFERFYNA